MPIRENYNSNKIKEIILEFASTPKNKNASLEDICLYVHKNLVEYTGDEDRFENTIKNSIRHILIDSFSELLKKFVLNEEKKYVYTEIQEKINNNISDVDAFLIKCISNSNNENRFIHNILKEALVNIITQNQIALSSANGRELNTNIITRNNFDNVELIKYVDFDSYFEPYVYNQYSKEYVLYQYLCLRGIDVDFDNDSNKVLIEKLNDSERNYLKRCLENLKIGTIKDKAYYIQLDKNVRELDLRKIFLYQTFQGHEVIDRVDDSFNNPYVYKRPIENMFYLEPFIAKYVVAINKSGVKTDFSCDGNHIKEEVGVIKLRFANSQYACWHKAIVNNIGDNEYKWDFYGQCNAEMIINRENITEKYLQIAKLADLILRDSDKLLKVREKIVENTKNIHPDTEEYKNEFNRLATVYIQKMKEEDYGI